MDCPVGFLGAGMMASAMIKGMISAGVAKPEQICASDCFAPCREALAAEGIGATADNGAVVKRGGVVVLAVKPYDVGAVLDEVKPSFDVASTTLVSIAAGVPLAAIEARLPAGARVVRVMPNTPCLVGECASAFALGGAAGDADRARVNTLLESVGVAMEVKEKDLDAVTGLSGSGPAYVFMFIEALADGAVRAGLPRKAALALAAKTVRGAATMVLETGKHPGELKDQVTSPGGTTIAGVEALEKGGFRAAAMGAVVAAATRSKELAK